MRQRHEEEFKSLVSLSVCHGFWPAGGDGSLLITDDSIETDTQLALGVA